jgi:hypothetical protein
VTDSRAVQVSTVMRNLGHEEPFTSEAERFPKRSRALHGVEAAPRGLRDFLPIGFAGGLCPQRALAAIGYHIGI